LKKTNLPKHSDKFTSRQQFETIIVAAKTVRERAEKLERELIKKSEAWWKRFSSPESKPAKRKTK
jgi:hypothetical protein